MGHQVTPIFGPGSVVGKQQAFPSGTEPSAVIHDTSAANGFVFGATTSGTGALGENASSLAKKTYQRRKPSSPGAAARTASGRLSVSAGAERPSCEAGNNSSAPHNCQVDGAALPGSGGSVFADKTNSMSFQPSRDHADINLGLGLGSQPVTPKFKFSAATTQDAVPSSADHRRHGSVFADKTNSMDFRPSRDHADVNLGLGLGTQPATPQFKFSAATPQGAVRSSSKHRRKTPGAPSPMLWSPGEAFAVPSNFSWPPQSDTTPQAPSGPADAAVNTMGAKPSNNDRVDALASDFFQKADLRGCKHSTEHTAATTATSQGASQHAGAPEEAPKGVNSGASRPAFIFGASGSTSPLDLFGSQGASKEQSAPSFVFGNTTVPGSSGDASQMQQASGSATRTRRTRPSPGSGTRIPQPSFNPVFTPPLAKYNSSDSGASSSSTSSDGTTGESSHTLFDVTKLSKEQPAAAARAAPSKIGSLGDAAAASVHPAASAAPAKAPHPGPSSAAERAHAAGEACKQLGDDAYRRHDFLAAVQEYSNGITALRASDGPSKSMLALLHSNRAGARLMLKQPRAALSDSQAAMAVDAKCARAYLRATTCHTRLGDLASAFQVLDAIIERCSAASNHWQELMAKQKELDLLSTKLKRLEAAAAAPLPRDKLLELSPDLAIVMEQMQFSASAQCTCALLLLRQGRFAEALRACGPDSETKAAHSCCSWVAVQVHYQQGEMEMALRQARGLQQLVSTCTADGSDAGSSSDGVARVPPAPELDRVVAKMEKLLQLKQAGNNAVQGKRYDTAVEHYGAALAEGAPLLFASVLLANRAAAHQASGRLTEAIADCGRAKALNPLYAKAYSRMSTLLLEVRRAEAAADVLQQMLKRASVPASEQAEVQQRIKQGWVDNLADASQAQSKASWQKTPDHYRLLAVEPSCQEEDVRKSYRKLALRYHPDKALSNCRFELALGTFGVAIESSEVVEKRIQEESSWLFNFVNEAHEELSDKQRRRKVDIGLQRDEEPCSFFSHRSHPASTSYPWSTGSNYYSPGAGHYTYRSTSGTHAPSGAGPGAHGYGSTRGAGSASGASARPSAAAGAQRGPAKGGAQQAQAGGGAQRGPTGGGARQGPTGGGAQRGPAGQPRGGAEWWRRTYDSNDSNEDQDDYDDYDQYY